MIGKMLKLIGAIFCMLCSAWYITGATSEIEVLYALWFLLMVIIFEVMEVRTDEEY